MVATKNGRKTTMRNGRGGAKAPGNPGGPGGGRIEQDDTLERNGRMPSTTTSDSKSAAATPKGAVMIEDKGKQQALDRALSQIEKTFGKGSIMRLDADPTKVPPGISTGALSIDIALGGRGIPRGRVIEIYGPESSGKTTLALTVAANAQKQGGVAAFIDAEHALDPTWAKRLGVNIDELLVSQPDCGEQALEICELLVRSNAVDVIVVDSVAALIPRAEIEGEMGDTHVGLQARLMSQALRKLTGAINKSKCCVIFINQIREKIGVMFGSPETTPAAGPSSSTHPSASISAAPARSRTATPRSATRTRAPHREEQDRPALPRCRVRHHVR